MNQKLLSLLMLFTAIITFKSIVEFNNVAIYFETILLCIKFDVQV